MLRKSRATSKSRSSKTSSSKSRSRSRSRSRNVRSRSRSRGRSQGRSEKKQSKSKSPSRERKPTQRATTPTRSTKQSQPVRPSTPTRMSARLAAQLEKKETSETVKTVTETTSVKPKATQHREFGGALGTFLMTIFLPVTVYYINLACNKKSCSIRNIPKLPAWTAFFDLQAAYIFVGWFAFQAVLYMLPIGKVVMGQPQPIGNYSRLPYRCNGFFAYCVSILAFIGAVYYKVPVTIVYDKFLPLMTSAIIFSFVLALYLYIRARMAPSNSLSPGGSTGNIIYDFFMGRELNPRIGSFDLKFFCEMRPGLIGWVMLNFVFLVKDYEQDKQLDYSLLLVAFFQALYVADALWFEDAILTTMDIVYEGFGLMLSFGDLAWVPFMYTLQGRFLLEHPHPLPWYCLLGIVLLNGVGFYIFRGSNSQKNEYRKNPNSPALAHLETIPTGKRKKLLASGWWGICRKPNYLGDILMSIAWSLPCGFSSVFPWFYPIYFTILLIHRERRDNAICQKKYGFSSVFPWFYPIYFTILLIHRERRDDAICQKKYGSAWNKYCEKVKYRIIPGVY